MKVYNTLTRKKETLEPSKVGKITMYSCGPTVYGFIHIGNLRAAMVADLFYRYFKHAGYETTYVRNYTDIDDKIIKRAAEEGVSTEEITKKYTSEVELDYKAAGLLDPTYKTKATEHIPEMIKMIEDLIKRKHAYVVDGEVLYAIDSFKGYGKLSHKNIEDLIAGARVEVDQKKKNPLDFTLWKPKKEGEPSWPAPWGEGRPGWHIECSVMASKWLGDQIDIHHGAIDLIFPHHENEIAQTEGASGKDPFVKYWLHNAFLTLSREKMSKSLGNVFQAREFLKEYGGEVARYLMMSVHYRSTLDFSEDSIDQTITALQRIYEAKKEAQKLKARVTMTPDQRAESVWGEFVQDCEKTKKEIEAHYENDFNTPGAFGSLFTLIREFNRCLTEPKAQVTPAGTLAAEQFLQIISKNIGEVTGVGLLDPEKALSDLNEIRGKSSWKNKDADRPTTEEILKLIEERKQARAGKDFAKADEIRDSLKARGVTLKDSGSETGWSFD